MNDNSPIEKVIQSRTKMQSVVRRHIALDVGLVLISIQLFRLFVMKMVVIRLSFCPLPGHITNL